MSERATTLEQADTRNNAPLHLRVSNLAVRFDERWLFRNLTFDLPRGKFLAIVGPSGAGKTTLLATLAGFRSPDEGQIEMAPINALQNGQSELRSPKELRQESGIIFQRLMLSENAPLLTNVLCGRLGRHPWWRTLIGFPRHEKQEAYAILRSLGLGQMVHRAAATTSGGEQQRTAIARALFQEPAILFADEPVSALDHALAHRVMQTFRDEAQQNARTIVCVLHHQDLVEEFADQVLCLNADDPHGWLLREVKR